MKRFRKSWSRAIAGIVFAVFVLAGCTNDTVIDERGYRKYAYPLMRTTSADMAAIPLEEQVQYADLVLEAEVISVNPVEPAVYTYREGDPGVGFMKEERILQMKYELFTFEVKVTAILKGQSRILLDCLNRPNLHHLAPTVKVAIPPALRGMYEENYTNIQSGNKMLLLLMDYANGMYVPTSYYHSMYTIREGTAYLPNFIPEWHQNKDTPYVNLIDRPSQNDRGSYKELVTELKEHLQTF
ncbi:MAG: hypothetical protein ACOX6U_01115 [Oscillospiraceae bacterium]|jgi:hypothetical protein